MRVPFRFRVHGLTIVFVLLSLVLLALTGSPVSAQGEECPEGLVYLPADDFCVLPEDVPPGAEFIDQHAEDGESDTEDTPDDSEQPIDDEQEDGDGVDPDDAEQPARSRLPTGRS